MSRTRQLLIGTLFGFAGALGGILSEVGFPKRQIPRPFWSMASFGVFFFVFMTFIAGPRKNPWALLVFCLPIGLSAGAFEGKEYMLGTYAGYYIPLFFTLLALRLWDWIEYFLGIGNEFEVRQEME